MSDEIDVQTVIKACSEYNQAKRKGFDGGDAMRAALQAADLAPGEWLRDAEHDLERHMAIAQSETERAERLEAALQEIERKTRGHTDHPGPLVDNVWGVAHDALAPQDATSLTHNGRDERPKKGLWAPGFYANHCQHCGKQFVGDKWASSCADCAYAEDATPRYEDHVPSVQEVTEDWPQQSTPKPAGDHLRGILNDPERMQEVTERAFDRQERDATPREADERVEFQEDCVPLANGSTDGWQSDTPQPEATDDERAGALAECASLQKYVNAGWKPGDKPHYHLASVRRYIERQPAQGEADEALRRLEDDLLVYSLSPKTENRVRRDFQRIRHALASRQRVPEAVRRLPGDLRERADARLVSPSSGRNMALYIADEIERIIAESGGGHE